MLLKNLQKISCNSYSQQEMNFKKLGAPENYEGLWGGML